MEISSPKSVKFVESYVEARTPHRMLWNTWNQALIDVDKYKKYTNISISVWKYRELEEKFFFDGEKNIKIRNGPIYLSAIVDKLFFDFDCLDKNGNFNSDVYMSMIDTWKWAEKNNYKRDVSFTGGGYQMCIGADIPPKNYGAAMNELKHKLDIIFDKISLADMRRVVGSINFGKYSKTKRMNFCIPLYEYEVEGSFDYHRKLSMKHRKGLRKYGDKLYSPKKIDIKYHKKELKTDPNFSLDDGVDKILNHYGYMYQDLCPNMRSIIEQPHAGHKERLYLISYLKNIIGMEYGDTTVIIPLLLNNSHGNTTDGIHSLNEGQIKSIYTYDKGFSTNYLKAEGYCDAECNKCQQIFKEKELIGKYF